MHNIARVAVAGLVIGLGIAATIDASMAGPAREYASTARRIVAPAQRGNARAQAMLGFLYANGQGVPQSYDVAVYWYLQSAEQGDPTGQYLIGLMYDKGFGVTQDVVQAYKWLDLAAAHGQAGNRENYLRLREAVASKMTREQLSVAQQLAAEFIPRPR